MRWEYRRLRKEERRIIAAALRLAAAESEGSHRRMAASSAAEAPGNAETMAKLAAEQKALALAFEGGEATIETPVARPKRRRP